jgi:putative transposon-encoded protein
MKRLTLIAVALVCAVMFVAPSFAEDRLSLYGDMRVRAWDVDGSTEQSYFDQRLRIGTKINVADDVYVEMRADYGEGTWGTTYKGLITRPDRDGGSGKLDIDRGFLNINKEYWALRAGQQYLGLGVGQVLDANAPGFNFDLKFAPVTATVMYAKVDENGSGNDDDGAEDVDFYGANVNYACDGFSVNIFAGMQNDDTVADDSPVMFGIHGTASLGMVNITTELAMASGDKKVVKIGNNGPIMVTEDYIGTQFYLEGNANVTDALNIGAEFVYAVGADAGENQLTGFCNWWSFTPMSLNTPFAADISAFGNADPFDPTGNGAGVQGIMVSGKFVAMEDLSFGGKVGYFQPEDDERTEVDDITTFNVWMSYMLATNTEFALTYLYSDTEYDNDVDADAEKTLVGRLQINF